MKNYKIDQETVQKILDTADIVDVVSDFVSLKRRGANYIGLCPFHNERTPSFSVSKSKGICKCFSCGKGGSAVGFIMEHEQLSYSEALRYLAQKYNIEIKEHEMTDKERLEATERESLLATNDFALIHFEHNLANTPEGKSVGLSYFRQRGINEAMIKKYRLGYALNRRDDLSNAAREAGYREENLIKTGLVSKHDNGEISDRFRGRVIFPVFSISGKVVAFGGRILKTDKSLAKYVNSPESIIYSKSRELYGFYQAKSAIVKRDKCLLVEGYLDVISMAQSGIENVVASSGTSLTEGQIRLIHRFTENVTVIYDSDPAGIKASLRGIDMLLAEGLNVKVLLLPEGDDPDSFAQKNTSGYVEEYIAANETDFIKFKIDILLSENKEDPLQRARVTSNIVGSIAVIPNLIKRNEYIKECSYTLGVSEQVLTAEVQKAILKNAEQRKKEQQAKLARENAQPDNKADMGDGAGESLASEPTDSQLAELTERLSLDCSAEKQFRPYEKALIRLVLKYGALPLDEDAEGNLYRIYEYVADELASDGIVFLNKDLARLMNSILEIMESFPDDYGNFIAGLESAKSDKWSLGIEEIRQTAENLAAIKFKEQKLKEECEKMVAEESSSFLGDYIMKHFISSQDDEMRNLTTELVADKYTLSKIHTKYASIESEQDQLPKLVPRAVFDLKNVILQSKINEINNLISTEQQKSDPDFEYLFGLMKKQVKMMALSTEFARIIGDRVLRPRRK